MLNKSFSDVVSNTKTVTVGDDGAETGGPPIAGYKLYFSTQEQHLNQWSLKLNTEDIICVPL